MKHTILDLLRPVGPFVCQTQSLDAARRTLDRTKSEHVIVRDLSHRPVGVITIEDIQAGLRVNIAELIGQVGLH